LTKKLYIKTYGCQMNVYDSVRMAEVLSPLGFASVDSPTDADMVILNTCHIREKASEKVYDELGRLRQLKEGRDQDMTIAVAGCVAQAEGEELIKRAPVVDLVVGPQSYQRLPEMLARMSRDGGHQLEVDFAVEEKFDQLDATPDASGVTAFVTIQEGCDKFCSFCVVPYTRGAEFSRPVEDIVREVKSLCASGVREITLLGQNVNAYHGTDSNGREIGLGDLARRLAEIDGVWRIRYTTSHPRDMDDSLISAHGEVPALMPFLHLPVQSGSDTVLKSMNRRHTVDHYRKIIDRLRTAREDLVLSSDFIVGHPGESDQDFDLTMQLVSDITFAQAFSFKYSPRPGTPAAQDAQIPERVKDARLAALQSLLKQQQTAFNASKIGQTVPVLLERPGRHDGQVIGRSPYLQSVYLEAPVHRIGRMVDVDVHGSSLNSLTGSLVRELDARDDSSDGFARPKQKIDTSDKAASSFEERACV